LADDERATALGQRVENATERGRVFLHKLGVGLAERFERAAAGLLVGRSAAVLGRGAQSRLDHDSVRHLLSEAGEEAGECLSRPLRAGRNEQVVAPTRSDPISTGARTPSA
jgi:hypothetical protein